jgi:PAS domain S-box-containing protein
MGASAAEPGLGLATGRTVTEFERTKAALTETQARFGLLAQLAPVGIVQSDAAGRAVFVNDRWCAMAGVRAGQMLGTNWLDMVHPDDRALVEQAMTGVDRGEVMIDGRLCSPGGTEVWVQGTVVPLRQLVPGQLAQGQLAGTLATFTDISGRKRAEAEQERLLSAERTARLSLADQTERLNCLIATAIPGVLITDESGIITHANKNFGAMFGIEFPDRLVGTPVADTVRRIKAAFADPGEFVRRVSDAFTVRKPVTGAQMESADGRTLECDYWPMMVGDRYRGDIWLGWDMSERKALETQRQRLLEAELEARRTAELAQQKLEQQNRQLQELGEARSDFVATVSHELRTPLTSIVSFIELVRAEEGGLSSEGRHFLEIIQRNANRLIRLVGDLLLLNRLESGVAPLELAPVSLPELVGEAVRDASATAVGYGVPLQMEASDGPPVQADSLRLRQVLDNLIANAVKFSHPGDVVRVGSRWNGATWRIDVTDSGIGIPPEEIEQLFDRFVRASNARASGRPGTGLGLSVAKTIVEMHGGHITVNSALNQGTTFSIDLPGIA